MVLILVSIPLLEQNKLYFFGVEVFIFISLVLSVYIYRSLIQPLNLISEGIEAIKTNDFNTKFRKVGQWEMDNLIDVYNEMIESLRLKQLYMEKQNFFLQELINSAPSGIIILDFDEKVESMNPAAKRILGSEKFPNIQLTDFHEEFFQKLGSIEPGIPQTININGLKSYKCQRSHFFDRGFPRHFIIIEEMTEELLNSEKKAYSKIIRMMSHEINNTVGAINSILSSVMDFTSKLDNDTKIDYENALKVAIQRNDRLNKFMSNFADVARLPEPVMKPLDLNELSQSVYTLMSSTADKSIDWELALIEKDLIIEADAQQMEQVLVNILKNSIEAIENKGKISIITEKLPQPKLIIRDNGVGIDKDIKSSLFTPFFSTKDNGQGIGLTLIRDILLNHKFKFSLQTIDNEFTEFVIYFK